MNKHQGTLVLSSNRGRYAIGHPGGIDLTSGDVCEVFLAGQWIPGSIELKQAYSIEKLPHEQVKGYYFIASADHTVCGLCVGMRVRTG